MSDLVMTLEEAYLPAFLEFRNRLAHRYPNLIFKIFSKPLGTLTNAQSHTLGIECLFPNQPSDQADNIGFGICTYHLTTTPRISADVVWGNPSGYCEASTTEDCHSSDEWPIVTRATLDSLAKSFENLCHVFEEAVERGHPPKLIQ